MPELNFKAAIERARQMVTKANTTGISQSTGIINYNLEPLAKVLYPVITPLRNSIPRAVSNRGDSGVKWKAITAINPGMTSPTLQEGKRGGYIDQTEVDFSENFATIGLENYVTEQAIMAAEGFDNALAIAADNLIRSTMIAEEFLDLGGNQSFALGTASTPAGSLVAGGSMTAQATKAVCVALTLDGYTRAVAAGQVVQTVARTNGDGSTTTVNAGSSIVSAASGAVTTAGGNLSVTWTTAAKKGAFGYAWFTGPSAGPYTFAAVTSINVFKQTTDAAGTQLSSALAATDYSANPLAYDGLVTQAANNGAYTSLDGATLTADGAGGVVEIDAFLLGFYVTRKVTPTAIWCNPQQAWDITKKTLQGAGGSGAGIIRFDTMEGGQGKLLAGSYVTAYLNKFAPNGATEIPLKVHPNLPAGKLFFDCDAIPYPLSNIPGARRKLCRRDYWQVLWPQVTMNRQTGVYFDGLMQVYTPFALGVLDNIANG